MDFVLRVGVVNIDTHSREGFRLSGANRRSTKAVKQVVKKSVKIKNGIAWYQIHMLILFTIGCKTTFSSSSMEFRSGKSAKISVFGVITHPSVDNV